MPQIAAVVATRLAHTRNVLVAVSYVEAADKQRGHTWFDLKTGAVTSESSSVNGRIATQKAVIRSPYPKALVTVTNTEINYRSRTWTQTSRREPPRYARVRIGNFLSSTTAHFTLVGKAVLDGQQTFHLRSGYTFPTETNAFERWDLWISTASDLLVRNRATTRSGALVFASTLRWLPRTATNLGLLKLAIPTGFSQN